MNNRVEQATLEDVLDAYLASVEFPDSTSLAEWIRRYPQFERELTDFTVDWIRIETLPASDRVEVDEQTLILRAMSVAQNLLHEKRAERQTTGEAQPILGIIAEAAFLNLTVEQLARETELSHALVTKLDRRLIITATIPEEVIKRIARFLKRKYSNIAQYLEKPTAFSNRMRFKSKQVPQLPDQQDFFDAVSADRELTDQQRAFWLAQKQDF